jgi:hypothetical protein
MPCQAIQEELHRRLERYAEKAAEMRTIFDSDGGWSALLQSFAQAAAAR